MKIIVATDSFKGTLKSHEACRIIAEMFSQSLPEARIVVKPMADGGEGTAQAMIDAAHGRWIRRTVTGPLPDMQVDAGFAWFDGDRTALVEMAAASGLELLRKEQLDPLRTTTYGTGQLIGSALDHGAEEILLAVGGSATVDGGVGAATALGWKFIGSRNEPVPPGGQGLERIADIVEAEGLNLPPVKVLCDVDNPLCGRNGAAKVYGPQKGANSEMVERLEKGLAHLADLVERRLGCDIRNVPGGGAAGGLAAGAVAFMNGAIVSGIETVMERTGLRAELESADWIITGEGCFDEQSLRGKVVAGIAEAAVRSRTRVGVIAGEVTVPSRVYQEHGIVAAASCRTPDMSLDDALRDCRSLLRGAARRFVAEWLAG
jgi:glycerate kinase